MIKKSLKESVISIPVSFFRSVFTQIGLGLHLSVEITETWKVPFSSKALSGEAQCVPESSSDGSQVLRREGVNSQHEEGIWVVPIHADLHHAFDLLKPRVTSESPHNLVSVY